jgi:hypothetical protein
VDVALRVSFASAVRTFHMNDSTFERLPCQLDRQPPHHGRMVLLIHEAVFHLECHSARDAQFQSVFDCLVKDPPAAFNLPYLQHLKPRGT